MHVVSIAPSIIKKSSLFEVESSLSSTEDSVVTGVSTSNSATRMNERSALVATPRQLLNTDDNIGTITPGTGTAADSSSGTGTSADSSGNKRSIDREELDAVPVKKRH